MNNPKSFICVKILKFFDVDPGWTNSDPGWKKAGSTTCMLPDWKKRGENRGGISHYLDHAGLWPVGGPGPAEGPAHPAASSWPAPRRANLRTGTTVALPLAALLIIWTNGRQVGAVTCSSKIHRGFSNVIVIADVAAEAVAVGNNIVVVGF
jgi:hypothetical protein